jgi:hypothetical protein
MNPSKTIFPNSPHIWLQTDLDMLCMAMTNLKVRSPLKNCAAQFKKPSIRRQHKAQTLCVDKTGADGMAEPCKLATPKIVRVIDTLARKRKSKKARARAKARAKAKQSLGGTVTCDRGDYVAKIQLHA